MTDILELISDLPADDPTVPGGVDGWTDALRKYIRPLADALRSARQEAERSVGALAASEETWAAICGQQTARIAELGRQLDALTEKHDHERKMANEWLTQLHAAGEEIEQLKGAAPRETSASIARWQNETFGPATTTLSRVARSSGLMLAALHKASSADMSVSRPNLSRAIRATEELAELIEMLVVDDNDPDAPVEVADIDIVLEGIPAAHGLEKAHLKDEKMVINRARTWQLTGDGHAQHVADDERANG